MKATLPEPVSGMIEPARRPIEIAARLVRNISRYSKDPNELYGARRQVVEELLNLEKPPRLIVHTNPLEHSTVANDCSLDVFGWAEPGTKIVVNGRHLPLSPNGLFMENMRLSRDNTIVVDAEHSKGKKRTVRSFEVMYNPNRE
jgi:hypothetical protein